MEQQRKVSLSNTVLVVPNESVPHQYLDHERRGLAGTTAVLISVVVAGDLLVLAASRQHHVGKSGETPVDYRRRP